MKLAVSTLGMPGQSLPEAIAIARRAGCSGLELRLHPDTGVHTGMSAQELATTRAALQASDLSVIALAGYARIAAPGPDAGVVAELVAGLGLADALGAPALRAFPGGTDTSAAVRRVRAAADSSPGSARIVVETHDDMPTGEAVARLLDTLALPGRTGAVWDLLHPWRHGEQPATTFAALAGWLGYVQIKDATAAGDPAPLGTGVVPLAAAGAVLRDARYDGWISLEWERTWYPQAAPVSQILPAARQWCQEYSTQARRRAR
jgi:sugar phosphate isomerase/epimerase